jgi:hypothetical protein
VPVHGRWSLGLNDSDILQVDVGGASGGEGRGGSGSGSGSGGQIGGDDVSDAYDVSELWGEY